MLKELEAEAARKRKLHAEMKANNGKVAKIDMAQIVLRAEVNANRKPAYDINLTHLSTLRNPIENELATLTVIQSFISVRQVLEEQLKINLE